MEQDSSYIHKSHKEEPALDFLHLREEAIKKTQEISGSVWTDYNIHDPGLTILEQLCFALTELGYKANFPIEDLLASQANNKNIHDTYYSAAGILTCNPITINDFRKLLIDRIKGLRNIWLTPLNLSDEKSQIKGIYMVYAEASPDSINTEAEERELKKNIWSYITKYCNLGEAFEKVIILERLNVYVEAEIELEHGADINQVHAEINLNISNCLSRAVTFKNLSEVMENQQDINLVFDGPRLKNGFIEDSELNEKPVAINPANLIKVVKEVKGVAKIKKIVIKTDDDLDLEIEDVQDSKEENIPYIEFHKTPVFANPFLNEGDESIKYFVHKSEVKIRHAEFKKNYDALLEKNKANYLDVFTANDDIAIPKGEYMNLGSYSSVQNHFPGIYGLGANGLSKQILTANSSVGSKNMRVSNELAQLQAHLKQNAVMQLKAYLLFFDQIMANFLAQLHHFSDLYATDTEIQHTYFSGVVSSLHHTKHLLRELDPTLSDKNFNTRLKEISEKSLNTIDDFYKRRNQFLDHLLARFGEDTSIYTPLQKNYYLNSKDHEEQIINAKIKLLKNIPYLSRSRARSFDYEKDYWGNNFSNTSFLEWKIEILLGLPNVIRALADDNKVLLKYFQRQDVFEKGKIFAFLRNEHISWFNYEIIEINPYAKSENTDNQDVLDKIHIDAELLKKALIPGNLAVVKNPDSHPCKAPYALVFNRELSLEEDSKDKYLNLFRELIELFNTDSPESENNKLYWRRNDVHHYILDFKPRKRTSLSQHVPEKIWQHIGHFHSMDEAINAASTLCGHIREISQQAEGYYLIDHILLRPRTEIGMYGLHFIDNTQNISFKSHQQFDFFELQAEAIKIINKLKTAEARISGTANRYKLHMYEGEECLGYVNQAFSSKEAAENYASSQGPLKTFASNFRKSDFYDKNKFRLFKLFDNGVNEADYSFRLSVVLPNWTMRFSNTEFQQALENAFRQECPAHLAIDFKWVNYHEMLYFESIYKPWLDHLQQEYESTQELNEASAKILAFLKDEGEPDEEAWYLTNKTYFA